MQQRRKTIMNESTAIEGVHSDNRLMNSISTALMSGTYTVDVVLIFNSNSCSYVLISMYCVGTLLQPCQFPRMYFLVCELCVSTSC